VSKREGERERGEGTGARQGRIIRVEEIA